jgi:hypothetical protein
MGRISGLGSHLGATVTNQLTGNTQRSHSVIHKPGNLVTSLARNLRRVRIRVSLQRYRPTRQLNGFSRWGLTVQSQRIKTCLRSLTERSRRRRRNPLAWDVSPR